MKKVPEGVIERLPAYLRCLLQLEAQGVRTVSSKRIGSMTGVNSAEIRRDLIYFGSFGIKGVGYEVSYLIGKIREILGAGHPHEIAIVGAGNLGQAIANHGGLRTNGFTVTGIFDNDPAKVGLDVGGVKVAPVGSIARFIKDNKISIAILAVPPANAQLAADLLVEAGISVILNYTSVMIAVPGDVQLHNSDPVGELLYTLHFLSGNQDGEGRRG